MKTEKISILVLILVSALFVGCAQESSIPGGGGPLPVCDNCPPPPPTSGENVVTLNIVGSSLGEQINNFSRFIGQLMYNPQNIQAHVNLVDRGGGAFGGSIKITYVDNGIYREERFINGEDPRYLGSKNARESAKYNKLFKVNGEWVFHGFFQDRFRGLIIVLDDSSDIGFGDGQIPKTYNGSIYYKLFGDVVLYPPPPPHPGPPPHPPTHCWFVSLGPYDCRSWKSGDGVDTTKAILPDNGYIKLGEFEGLSFDKAFN